MSEIQSENHRKTDIKSMDLAELKAFMTSIGEKPFRASQIYQWMHVRHVSSWDEMTNLSKALREKESPTKIMLMPDSSISFAIE